MDRRLALTAVAGVFAAVLFVVVASADPAPLARRAPSLPFDMALPELTPSTVPELVELAAGADNEPSETSEALRALVSVLQYIFAGALLALVVFGAYKGWQNRPRLQWRRRTPPPDFAVLPDIVEAIVRDAEAQAVTLRTGQARNAIVACWSRLEEIVATAGSSRDPADTPSEFTARVLARHTVDGSALDDLAQLYREARFSTHDMSEADRLDAIDALERLHADLARYSSPAVSP